MSETGRSILATIILFIILLAAIAIMVSPEFAQFIAVLIIVVVIAGLLEKYSGRR